MVRRRRPLLGLCLLLFAVVAGGSSEPSGPPPAALRAYEQGARELEFGRYGEAATAFAAAIATDPRETAALVVRSSGMNFGPYLPHLALGLARCESGDVAGAWASWVESDRQAVAAGARDSARLRARRESCTERQRDRFAAVAAPASTVSVPEPVRAPVPATVSTPVRVPESTEATDRAVPDEANRGEREPAPSPPAPAALETAADAPPPTLLRAAQELFDGHPAATVQLLERFESARSRARAQGHLLLAAACFDLARLEPPDASRWLARARTERLAARQTDAELAPDRRYFSPAFIEFYRSGVEPPPLPDLLEP